MKPAFEKLFGFDSKKNNVRTEILAGITTFLTMAYILAVNPGIFSALPGMPAGSQEAFRPCPRYGPQRLLRVHSMPWNGLQLAVCTYGSPY